MGINPKAAYVQGMDVVRNLILVALISGGIAGIAGAVELMGIHFHLRENLSLGYGYTGIVVAMLGLLHPIGVVLAAFFMATIETGSQAMYRATGIPYPLAYVIEGVTLVFVLIAVFFMEYRLEKVEEER
jgi:simple sugar transport system permease protein